MPRRISAFSSPAPHTAPKKWATTASSGSAVSYRTSINGSTVAYRTSQSRRRVSRATGRRPLSSRDDSTSRPSSSHCTFSVRSTATHPRTEESRTVSTAGRPATVTVSGGFLVCTSSAVRPAFPRSRTAGVPGASSAHTSARTSRRSTATVTMPPCGPAAERRAIHNGTPSDSARRPAAATSAGPPLSSTASSPRAPANAAACRTRITWAEPVTWISGTTPGPLPIRASSRSSPRPPSHFPRRYASAMAIRCMSRTRTRRPRPTDNVSAVSRTFAASGFHALSA
ncbi:hypothetical protein [Streptomyces sp. B5E4]|uniref:hypothetical protein n=1 Tax=Streptomyces sp. B5E4 TaxID=3153568 RepID=UPI00325D1F7C